LTILQGALTDGSELGLFVCNYFIDWICIALYKGYLNIFMKAFCRKKNEVIFQKPTKDNIIFQNIVTKIIAATIVIVLQNYINIDVLTDNLEYFMPGRVF